MEFSKEFKEFVKKYAKKKFRKTNEHWNMDYWTYSSNTGKFGMSNYLLDIMCREFTAHEVAFVMKVISLTVPSKNFMDAGVVKLTLRRVKGFATRRNFKSMKDKLIEKEILIETPHPKYFILNVRFINRFYKTKVKSDREYEQ